MKTPEAARRPGFPVSLKTGSGLPSATKNIAANAAPASARCLNGDNMQPRTLISSGAGLDAHPLRARMVQKLAAQGLADPQVLAAMGVVERHRFVDSALGGQAYEDTSLPIGLGQTISKPNVVARMLELLMRGQSGKLGRVL